MTWVDMAVKEMDRLGKDELIFPNGAKITRQDCQSVAEAAQAKQDEQDLELGRRLRKEQEGKRPGADHNERLAEIDMFGLWYR